MSLRTKGVLVLAVQLALALSVAAKFAWERHTCPMVWTRASQYDPDLAVRGRYLALRLHADACGLPKAGHEDRDSVYSQMPNRLTGWRWEVMPAVREGHLVPRLAEANKPGEIITLSQTLFLAPGLPCSYAVLQGESTNFYIPEHARTPFPLLPGQQLWALVTMPPSGPPRPVRLAVSDGASFRVLDVQ